MTGFIDTTLDWSRGQDHWHKDRMQWTAQHRDDRSSYTLYLRVNILRFWSPTDGTTEVVERHWIAEYQPVSPDWDAIVMHRTLYCGNDLRAARRTAEKHHVETRRMAAWNRYMRTHEPPAPTTPEEEQRWRDNQYRPSLVTHGGRGEPWPGPGQTIQLGPP
ncbi:hypothetical protein E3G52_000328 [Mycobacteroides abscessus]|uniref:hypothetical protein n=1 Tax=Mycobacteroides abscessus TaxID=36809 RepID=UPI001877E0C0|nr:hypothetical protein [Mycobacteroides abscessus]MBE5453464.1 hypothetical protein [Mycobacteroides abscessus]